MQLVSTDSKWTAVLTKLENCHKDLMSIFVEAFTDTSLKRVNDVDEVDIQTADNFLAKIHMEECMDVIKNPHWLHDDMVTKSNLVKCIYIKCMLFFLFSGPNLVLNQGILVPCFQTMSSVTPSVTWVPQYML